MSINNDELELVFDVRDTGIGIPEDKISRLFKAFSQVDSSTTRKYGGTGLGLVISERLVKLMKGTISVKSIPREGTTFSFTTKNHFDKASMNDDASYRPVGREGKKVLLVDNNASSIRINKTILEHWGFCVTSASSGKQAVRIMSMEESAFDLVVADMQLPEMDTLELCQQIKQLYPVMPIILLSKIGKQANLPPGLCNAMISKPVRLQQLSKGVTTVLSSEANVYPVGVQVSNQVLSEDFASKYPLRIMLAEDNPVNQKLTIRVLGKLGYHKIMLAVNGMDVIDRFDEQFYDVILMDVQMPEMDGLEATRLIRQKQYQQPIIVALTANVMTEDREACRKAGMDDYLSKPIKLDLLVALLEKWAVELKRRLTVDV